jgi:hypothetical protein
VPGKANGKGVTPIHAAAAACPAGKVKNRMSATPACVPAPASPAQAPAAAPVPSTPASPAASAPHAN